MRKAGPLILVLVLIVAGIAGLLALASGAKDRRLDNSVIGINGLARLLDLNDIPFKRSHPRLSPHVRDMGLRVLPLYDLDLASENASPRDAHERFFQSDIRDVFKDDLITKLEELPTLIVLPKWVQGTIETKTASDATLIPKQRFNRLFAQLDIGKLRLSRGANDMVTIGDVSLFLPQSFNPDTLPADCSSLRMFGEGHLVIDCALRDTGTRFFVVSDPDLINNHGLAVGRNGNAILDLIRLLTPSGDRPLYVDTSQYLLLSIDEDTDERRDYSRSASDFARFFDAPFDMLWAMLLIVTGIFIWRGAVRFGPTLPDQEDSPEQSKTEAIATNARLLRLCGHDGHLVADFVRGQITELTRQTFGTTAGQAGMTRFFAFLARRDPDLAQAFEASARTLMNEGPTLPQARLHAELDQYRTLLESVTNAHDLK